MSFDIAMQLKLEEIRRSKQLKWMLHIVGIFVPGSHAWIDFKLMKEKDTEL